MNLEKSTRHSKITGDFAEALVLYWLSKYGFECARVDHTGIDLIARNPKTKELMGISVKSRSRNIGKESTFLTIKNDNIEKAEKACEAFMCKPYFSIVVDAADNIIVFILPLEEFLKVSPKGKATCIWKMTPKHIENYLANPNILAFEFTHKTVRWF